MKSFTAIVMAASAATVSAQLSYNQSTGVFVCPVPNGAYCAGDSLQSNIIIRCTDGIGHPGNCNDNLAGQFPLGVNFSPCWQPSAPSGQAACSKNCVVYGQSGNYNGTFTLPDCQPYATPSLVSTSTTLSTSTSLSTVTSTICTECAGYGTGVPTAPGPVLPTGGATVYPDNSTTPTYPTTTAPTDAGSATATPVAPTATPSYTGAAIINTGSYLAGVGLVAAYFL